MRRSGSGEPELQSPASNLAHLGNPENPAHLWLQALEHAGERGGLSPAPGGVGFWVAKNLLAKKTAM